MLKTLEQKLKKIYFRHSEINIQNVLNIWPSKETKANKKYNVRKVQHKKQYNPNIFNDDRSWHDENALYIIAVQSCFILSGPVPTPPTSVRSLETPGSEHGTTLHVNMPSEVSNRSQQGSELPQTATSPIRVTTETCGISSLLLC